jgi:hypothetical protein
MGLLVVDIPYCQPSHISEWVHDQGRLAEYVGGTFSWFSFGDTSLSSRRQYGNFGRLFSWCRRQIEAPNDQHQLGDGMLASGAGTFGLLETKWAEGPLIIS